MSNKVIAAFRDKTDNGKRYKKGDTYSHPDEKRIAFLVEKGFLEKTEESKQTAKKQAEEKPKLETKKKADKK